LKEQRIEFSVHSTTFLTNRPTDVRRRKNSIDQQSETKKRKLQLWRKEDKASNRSQADDSKPETAKRRERWTDTSRTQGRD
jgi:hypothetical protein